MNSSDRPFWLSPRQVLVIPVAAPYVRIISISDNPLTSLKRPRMLYIPQKDYASEVADRLTALGLWADVDNGENTLPKKIRNGEIAQYNFIFGMFLHVA